MNQEEKITIVGVVGSRTLSVPDLGKFLPPDTEEIVSGRAKGVDTSARLYALENNLKLTEFLPDYKRYGQGAPLKRNIQIIEHSQLVLIFWDGKSTGTKHVIENCKKLGVPSQIYIMTEGSWVLFTEDVNVT